MARRVRRPGVPGGQPPIALGRSRTRTFARPGSPRLAAWLLQDDRRGGSYRTAVKYHTLSDGYVMDSFVAWPKAAAPGGLWPVMIFLSGSGGDRMTNIGRASAAAALGIVGVSVSQRGQGEGGFNLNNPATYGAITYGIREVIDALELPEVINDSDSDLAGRLDLTKVGYFGTSRGGRNSLNARGLGGYSPIGGDYEVVQGWRSVGEAYLTPAFVVTGSWEPDQSAVLLPGYRQRSSSGASFHANLAGIFQSEAPFGSWTEENSGLGMLFNTGFKSTIQGYISADDVAGLETYLETDAAFAPMEARVWPRQATSEVPTYIAVNQGETWAAPNTAFDLYDTLSAAGKDAFYILQTTGGHKSSDWDFADQAKEQRLAAAMRYHLLGDDSLASVFNPDSPPNNWAGIPHVGIHLIPHTQADYHDSDYEPQDLYFGTPADLADPSPSVYYLHNDGTLQASEPGAPQVDPLDRAWLTATTMADFTGWIPSGDEPFEEIVSGGRIDTSKAQEYTFTVPGGDNLLMLGEPVLKNLRFTTDNTDVQIGVVLEVTRSAVKIPILSGSYSVRDAVGDSSTVNGPFDVPLERVAFEFQPGDIVTLRLTPWAAKERVMQDGTLGFFREIPFFDAADVDLQFSDTPAQATHLELPITELQAQFDLVTDTGDELIDDLGANLQAVE